MNGRMRGTVAATRGNLVDIVLPGAVIGGGVRIGGDLAGRIVALRDGGAVVAPFGAVDGIAAGAPVLADPRALTPVLGTALLGRAVDARGLPLDGGPRVRGHGSSVRAQRPGQRVAVREICWTGVRAIDGPLTFARGARIGVFGAAGAGKTTLLDAIVRGADADAVVLGLIGERGREAERAIAGCGPSTTIVCATSDRAPAERVRAAELAFAQAQGLCARGLDVLLVLDSLARTCAAQRELALAAGEPAGRAGYPPSVFALLAQLLERAGAFACGSITLVATVLADGPQSGDPVGDAARAALDGHLVLSERLARLGHFPAIDLGRSVSRTFDDVVGGGHAADAGLVRKAAVALEESAEPRALGLDPTAGDPFLARCLAAERSMNAFLQQSDGPAAPGQTLTELAALADRMR